MMIFDQERSFYCSRIMLIPYLSISFFFIEITMLIPYLSFLRQIYNKDNFFFYNRITILVIIIILVEYF
jgi:hypothetical protein